MEKYLTGIRFVFSTSQSGALQLAEWLKEEGYAVDYHNLNSGVSDAGYIFMCTRTETQEELVKNRHRPITNLFMYCDDKDHKGFQYDRFSRWQRDKQDHVQLDGVTLSRFEHIGKEVLPHTMNYTNSWYDGNLFDEINSGNPFLYQQEHTHYYASSVEIYNPSDDISNLNHGGASKKGRFILLCYTTDSRFTPITALCAYNDKAEGASIRQSGWHTLPMLGRSTGDSCSTNAGHSKRDNLYLAIKRSYQLLDYDRLMREAFQEQKAEADRLAHERFEQTFGRYKAFPSEQQSTYKGYVILFQTALQRDCTNYNFDNYKALTDRYKLSSEEVWFPYRIDFSDYDPLYFRMKDENIKLVLDCLLTRHPNGYTREKYLRNILNSAQIPEWCLPYILRLAGEYVMEIDQVIYDAFRKKTPAGLKTFCKNNAELVQKNYRRMCSYWENRYKDRVAWSDYVGRKLFEEFFLK